MEKIEITPSVYYRLSAQATKLDAMYKSSTDTAKQERVLREIQGTLAQLVLGEVPQQYQENYQLDLIIADDLQTRFGHYLQIPFSQQNLN